MRKQASIIEWHIAESDADWDLLHIPLSLEMAPDANPRLRLKRHLAVVAALLLLLASAGGWWWRTDRAALVQPVAEMVATAQSELRAFAPDGDPSAASLVTYETAPDSQRQFAQENGSLRTTIQSSPDSHGDVALYTVEFWSEQAVVRVVVTPKNGAPAYRQTRFYQRTSTGWLQTEPDGALWGAPRILETPSFVYHFRQNDAQAVIAVMPQVEILYTTLRRDFGLPLALGAEKLVIEVSVTQSPGYPLFQQRNDERFVMDDLFLVPSPAVYLAPVELTDAELLAQSIALPLLAHVVAQAREHHTVGSAWQPVMGGLRLWQVWDMDLPLAEWRAGIVHWIYLDLPGASPDQPVTVPAQYDLLCAAHARWMTSPTELGIPLLCVGLDLENWYFPVWGSRHPPTRLNQIALPMPDSYLYERTRLRGQTVALAMLIEYAVVTYGRERLPALVAGLGHSKSWETLIPTVYGVSATEFEAGWQAYLTTRYGVSPDAFQ